MRATALLAALAVALLSARAEAQLSVSEKGREGEKEETPTRVRRLFIRRFAPSRRPRPPPLNLSLPLHLLPKPTKTKQQQAIQSAEETALNAYSAFKNLQLGKRAVVIVVAVFLGSFSSLCSKKKNSHFSKSKNAINLFLFLRPLPQHLGLGLTAQRHPHLLPRPGDLDRRRPGHRLDLFPHSEAAAVREDFRFRVAPDPFAYRLGDRRHPEGRARGF